jgi:hypothetical protein
LAAVVLVEQQVATAEVAEAIAYFQQLHQQAAELAVLLQLHSQAALVAVAVDLLEY